MIVFLAALIGLIIFILLRISQPAFFKGQTLTRSTPPWSPTSE